MLENENPFEVARETGSSESLLARSFEVEKSPLGLSRSGMLIATTPWLVMTVLFYSLAIHMYLSLGKWPKSIGERGFPSALVLHALVTNFTFLAMILSCVAWPFAVGICALNGNWHFLIKYLVLYLVCGILYGVLMSMAPHSVAPPLHFQLHLLNSV